MRAQAPWRLVAGREIMVKLTDKTFIVSTVLTVLLVFGSLFAPTFFTPDAPSYAVAVTSDEGEAVVDGAATVVSAGNAESATTAERVADRDAAEAAVVDGDADAALVGGPGQWELLSEGGAPGPLEAAVTETVRTSALAENAQAAGTSVDALTQGSTVGMVDLAEDGTVMPEAVTYAIGFAFAMMFYFAAIVFGMQIANSVVEEKQSRIVEILAAKIPTRQLLLGKVLGNTVLAFGQIALISTAALIGLTFIDLDVALPGLAGAIGWYVPFFVLGFLALACVWAAAGALASRTEDLQQTTMPLIMVLVIALVLGLYLEGFWQQVVSFVPVLSTILMPVRLIEGDVALWEPILALGLVLGFCAVTITLGARLYERALLHTSGSLGWRKAMSLSKD
ncbi:ABC transporter permease [Serinicoccus kebangsaanensis]|uniref:ABC transporter permease n=1 Tax=Serinicoccus kebangsaanensis TaxID=2602069 RepID=UPI00124EF6CE|nr:ABC transporter permease [Serinicoccus kebangsaanensis]